MPKKSNDPNEARKAKEAKDAKEVEVCNVCANHYTAIVRKKLTCPYCAGTNCSQCLSTYLMSLIGDPACMHCRVGLNDDYLASALTKTYIKGPLFKQRQAVLIQRNRVELPRLQESALREKKRRDNEALLSPLKEAVNALMAPYREAQTNMYLMERNAQRTVLRMHLSDPDTRSTPQEMINAAQQRDAARLAYRRIATELSAARSRVDARRRELRHEEPQEAESEEEKPQEEEKKFIRRCTRSECQGFLSTAWKCGLCEWYSCSHCFAPRGEKHDTPHECKKEDVESADLIKKDSKPCPKCGEFIHKYVGCAQVWCVVCHTAFDWGTGKIVTTGIIHNPHYYEWLKRTGGDMPRNPADVPCGGYPAAYQLVDPRHCRTHWMRTALGDFHRVAMELQEISENQYRTYIDQHGFDESHIKFLLGDIDEKKWGQLLASHEKKRKRDREVQDVFAAFRMVAVELINRLQNFRTPKGTSIQSLPSEEVEPMMIAFAQEAYGLIQMINAAFKKIGETTGHRVPYFQTRYLNPTRFIHMNRSDHQTIPEDCIVNYILESKTFELVGSRRPRGKQERVDSDSEEETVAEVPLSTVAAQAAPIPDPTEDMEDVEDMEDMEEVVEVEVEEEEWPKDSDDEIAQIQAAIANSLKVE